VRKKEAFDEENIGRESYAKQIIPCSSAFP